MHSASMSAYQQIMRRRASEKIKSKDKQKPKNLDFPPESKDVADGVSFTGSRSKSDSAKNTDDVSDKENFEAKVVEINRIHSINKTKTEHQLEIAEAELINAQKATEVALERARIKEIELDIADQANRDELNISAEKQQADEIKKNLIISNIWRWVKLVFFVIFMIILLLMALLMLYRLYRWSVEEPLTIEVEKIVEVDKVITPEECTQFRRNGQIYMNCDGKIIKGAPTLHDSGIKEIPELLD